MALVKAQGTKLYVGDGNTPEVFIEIGEITSIDWTSDSPEVDVTNLSSTSREYRAGLPDPGRLSFTVRFDNTDAGQARLEEVHLAQDEANFQMHHPTTPLNITAFTGSVLSLGVRVPIGEFWEQPVVVRASGRVSFR